jgi:hypothetical protein
MERYPKPGEVVITFPNKKTEKAFIATEDLLKKRKTGLGKVKGFVPGYGGDVQWIEHPDGEIAPYSLKEINEPQTELKFPNEK